MKLESLNQKKYAKLGKNQLTNVRGGSDMLWSSAPSPPATTFEYHLGQNRWTGVTADESRKDAKGHVIWARIRCEDGSWHQIFG